jgi:hypothetical protein
VLAQLVGERRSHPAERRVELGDRQRLGAGEARHRVDRLVEPLPGLDQRRDPVRQPVLADAGDVEQVVVALEVALDALAAQVVEAVEVSEHRRRRDPGVGGDLLGGRWGVSGEDEIDHRVDDRDPTLLAPESPPVDLPRPVAVPHVSPFSTRIARHATSREHACDLLRVLLAKDLDSHVRRTQDRTP